MKRCPALGGIVGLTILTITVSIPGFSLADTVTLSGPAHHSLSGESISEILVNRDVINNNEDAVGTIHSVCVDAVGRVDYVVIDVSAWLNTTKLIAVPWRDLTVDSDGNVRTTMTKDLAKRLSAYTAQQSSVPNHAMTGIKNFDNLYRKHTISSPGMAASLSASD